MNIKFNRHINNLKQSDIRRMSIECAKHPQGINLSQGICDLELSEQLISAVDKAIRDGYNIYTRYDGLDELRTAVARKLKIYNQLDYNQEKEILITNGSTGGFYIALAGLFEKGDSIILFEPYYGYHYNTILSLGLNPITCELNYNDKKNQWLINFEKLSELIEKNKTVKAIVINTPANPNGKIFSKEEIKKIFEILEKNDIFLITDEIYEYIIFDNNEHISPAAVSANKEKVLTIGGFSKTFSITGWRLGYLCACEEIITKLGILNDLIYICAPAPLQKAVADILIQSDCTFKELKDFYQNNRDILVNTLNEIGLTPCVPEGAYYLLADISKLNCKNSRQAADMILQNTGVATVPGSAFFNTKSGERFVRFCFAKKKDILLRACEQLKKLSFF